MKGKTGMITALLLVLTLGLSVFGCAPQSEKPGPDDGGEQQTETSFNDLVVSLSGSDFADSALHSSAYGLSSPEKVGVDAEKFENEVLYEAPSDAEFEEGCIFTLSEQDGYAEMKDVLERAAQKNAEGNPVKIRLPQTISFDYSDAGNRGAQLFSAEGFDGLYIEGADTQITIENDGENFCGLFQFSNCKNLFLSGISVDYSHPSVFTGTVEEVDTENNTVKVKILEEFLPMFRGKSSVDLKVYTEYGRYTHTPKEDGNAFFVDGTEGDILSATIEGDIMTIRFKAGLTVKPAVKGTLAAMSYVMRNTVMLNFTSCENVEMEHVTLYSSAGMGVTSNYCKNLYINHFREEIKEGTNRLITTTSDGMHLVGTTGDLHITNTLLENNVDDGINVKCGYYMKLLRMDIRTDTLVFQRHYNGIADSNSVPSAGDVIEIYDKNLNPVSSVTVESVQADSQYFTVVVKGNYDAAEAGFYAANVSVSPDFVFRNNIIRNKRNRGALIQLRGGVIENCTFSNLYHGAINLVAEVVSGAWETMMPADVTVKNCKFINNNHATGNNGDIYVFTLTESGAAEAGAITGITVENNFFTQSAGAGICFSSVSDSIVKNNLFYDIASNVFDASADCALMLNNCLDINVKGNFNSNINASEEYCGIRFMGSTDTDRIILEGNTAMEYPKTGEVTTTRVAKLQSAVTVDGDLSDWEGVGTPIEIVGESLADGTAYTDYKDDFEVKTMKIGWTDDGIFLAFDVYDNYLDFRTLDDFYIRDCIEIFAANVTMNNTDIAALTKKGTVFQAGFIDKGHTCTEVRTSSDILSSFPYWQYKMVKRADGYSAEIFMPFKYLGGIADTIAEGKSIAMSFVVGDGNRENPTRVRLQVSNVAHFVETNKFNSTSMPQFLFVEK